MLPTEQHRRVRKLLDQTIGQPSEAVERLLANEPDAVAAEVRKQLAERGQATVPQGVDVPTNRFVSEWPPGTRIGRYIILEKLGEGGFGSVYKAEQREPIKRTVALKIIKAGFDTKEILARFESERQALARMDHPHVARVLDAGSTDTGRPFFVMEYVAGLPVTDFADTHKLDIRQRLELFAQVCDAITHAHQKAILHRDIKPSNVLASMHDGKPTAKVIDFGIAKAMTTDRLTDQTFNTSHGMAIGTYDSMSPEQADGSPDIDTRSDVYSLGVLLYELLTGSKPFDFGKLADEEIRRVIRDVEPPTPSTRLTKIGDTGTSVAQRRQTRLDQLTRQLRTELEWIPLKAMRKERQRRYESPAELRQDIENYLEGSPLIAGPESRAYVLKKWTRKHRAAVATAAGILLLVIGAVAAYVSAVQEGRRLAQAEQQKTEAALAEVTVQKTEAERQRTEAERRAAESAAVVDFINSDVFAGATPERMPDTKVRDEIVTKMLEPAAKAVREKFKDQPLVEAAVSLQIGVTFRKVGRLSDSVPLLHGAVELRARELGEDHPQTINAVNSYAVVLMSLGRSAEAEPLIKDALERRRRVLGEDHPDTITSISGYAFVLNSLGRSTEAEPLYRDALERHRRVLGEDHPDTIGSISRYAVVLRALGRSAEAEPLHRDALERSRRVLGEDHPDTITLLNNYASVLAWLGRSAEAEPLYKDALERSRRVLGEDHPDTITSINGYAEVLRSLGRLAEAEPLHRDALERSRRVLGEDHPYTIRWIRGYAHTLELLGRSADAEPLYKDALERSRRVQGENHPDTIASISRYAAVLRRLDRPAAAEPLLRTAVELCRRALGDDHPQTISAVNSYAVALRALGRSAEAEPLYKDVLERNRRVLGEDHPNAILSKSGYAHALELLDRSAEAEPLARDAVARAERNPSLGPDHQNTKGLARRHASILDNLGRADEAAAVRAKFGLPEPTEEERKAEPPARVELPPDQEQAIQAFVRAFVESVSAEPQP